MSADLNRGILDATLEISSRRANNLRQIRSLILDGKKEQAWELLLKHLGIDEKTKVVKFPRKANHD